ncbi:MAG: DUF2635 domain-containing protein [Roseomonas mucosa]|nr:DUF2635 domain-containing protein [Roseomonas mucosa]
MAQIEIKPAPGRAVPMPDGTMLETKGRTVERDVFVQRLLDAEDVVEVKPRRGRASGQSSDQAAEAETTDTTAAESQG